jgi:gamma-glutamyltranspeptidase/glutathione hydrolase
VSTWVALSQKFGKLPFGRLFESAIGYAKDGFPVGPITAEGWQRCPERFSQFPDFLSHFCPGGRAPLAGEKFVRTDMVTSLEQIADSNGESFYRGALAEKIAWHAKLNGGLLTAEDLDQHSPLWTSPVSQDYRDIQLLEIPPNGQGLAAQIGLALLAHFELNEPDSAETIHLQVECMKIAIRAAFDHFADPDAMRIDPEELLGKEVIKRAAAHITHKALDTPPALLPVSADTVYLTTADADGMMVSFIQSNYQGFGSGIVIPETGISLQNRGRGFSIKAGHPNAVDGNKRPFHTIIPGFVSEKGAGRMSFGVMGGHM